MKIVISCPATAYKLESSDYIHDPRVLELLDNASYEGDSCANYLDIELIELGIVGGKVSFVYSIEQGLWLLTEYWAPRELKSDELDALVEDTYGQWSDGIGESGFRVECVGGEFEIKTDADQEEVSVEQVDDGKHIPPPSAVAIHARSGDINAMVQALDAGEDINRTLQDYTPLHWAVSLGNVNAAVTLLERGADPNALDAYGTSPIYLCAVSNSLSDSQSTKVAKALLRHGADKTVTTSVGHTATSLAENRGKETLLALLTE